MEAPAGRQAGSPPLGPTPGARGRGNGGWLTRRPHHERVPPRLTFLAPGSAGGAPRLGHPRAQRRLLPHARSLARRRHPLPQLESEAGGARARSRALPERSAARPARARRREAGRLAVLSPLGALACLPRKPGAGQRGRGGKYKSEAARAGATIPFRLNQFSSRLRLPVSQRRPRPLLKIVLPEVRLPRLGSTCCGWAGLGEASEAVLAPRPPRWPLLFRIWARGAACGAGEG